MATETLRDQDSSVRPTNTKNAERQTLGASALAGTRSGSWSTKGSLVRTPFRWTLLARERVRTLITMGADIELAVFWRFRQTPDFLSLYVVDRCENLDEAPQG